MSCITVAFVESTAESMKRVFGSVEELVASTNPDKFRGVVGRTEPELGSGDTTELIGGEVAFWRSG